MHKLSVLNKQTIYKMSRIKAGFTVIGAYGLVGLSDEKQLRRIEKGEARAHPDAVLLMAETFNDPLLPFEHCKHECSIGQIFHHDYGPKNLLASTVQLTNAIDRAVRIKNRLLEIAEDEQISEEEVPILLEMMPTIMSLEHKIGEFKLSITPTINLRDIMKNDPAAKQRVI